MVDKNKEIPLILAREVAHKKNRQLSIPPVLLVTKDKYSSLKYIDGALSQSMLDPRLGQNESGLHVFSPRVENKINASFVNTQRGLGDEVDRRQ